MSRDFDVGQGLDVRARQHSLFSALRLNRELLAARCYVHVTETHVAAGFGKFVEHQTRNVAEGIAAAFREASSGVQ
jgi:hypothetical protein